MEVPLGFESDLATKKVCKLKKVLYGLKQSPRAWFGRFAKVMKIICCSLSIQRVIALLIYVDDIIVTGNDKKERQTLKQCLIKEFEIKELGMLKYFLRIKVAYSKQRIFISQQKYITNLVKETRKLACKPTSTPIDPNNKLGKAEEDVAVDREMYQHLVGRLIYLSHTRPNIAYIVSVISQFMQSSKEVHLQAVNKVLQYLKGSPGKGILFK